jgi:hypothetical protein
MGLFANPLGYAGYPPGVTASAQVVNSTVRAATDDEAADGTLTDVYLSPATAQSSVALDFASPPVLGFGSTTPRPVHATTLSALGTTTINTSGAAATTLGTGGTGAVNIGNTTGNTSVTGSLTASTGLIATTGGITATAGGAAITGTTTINNSGSAVTTIGTGGTGAVNIGNATGNTAMTGSLTASTSLTATAGDITATLGNVIINGAAKQLRVHGGAVTDFIGTAVLGSGTGTVTVANTNIAATDRIFLQRIAANASTTLGELSYTISATTSFTITSLILGTPASPQTGDASTVAYFIVRQI